jgi:hypothetical protein
MDLELEELQELYDRALSVWEKAKTDLRKER